MFIEIMEAETRETRETRECRTENSDESYLAQSSPATARRTAQNQDHLSQRQHVANKGSSV